MGIKVDVLEKMTGGRCWCFLLSSACLKHLFFSGAR
jgi:hypothetical protein